MGIFSRVADRVVPSSSLRLPLDDGLLRAHGEQMHHDGTAHHTDDCGLVRRHYGDVVADNQRLRAANTALQAELDRLAGLRLHAPDAGDGWWAEHREPA